MANPPFFIRCHTLVIAQRFDGSQASALALAEAYPHRVARSLQHDDVLVFRQEIGGFAELRAGDWISQDIMTSATRIWRDAEFHLINKAFSFSQLSEP